MKKILITLFGLIALPVGATYYSGSDTYSPKSGNSAGPASYQKGSQSGGGAETFQDWLAANEKYAGIDFSKTRSRYHSWQGVAPPVDDPQAAWEAYERSRVADVAKKRKQSRNTSYGQPGSKPAKGSGAKKGSYGSDKSGGSFGSRKDWGGSKGSKGKSHSGGSKGAGSKGSDDRGSKANHSGGSKGGSRPGQWLDKEDKREKQLETFKKILMHKLDKLPDWNGDKDNDWAKDFDKDFWSDKELTRALLCWLAPHLHEDEKWVNRDWKKLQHKIVWWLKHHKHKFPHDKPDPMPEVPLPASVYLFGSALLGLGAIGRKRRRA